MNNYEHLRPEEMERLNQLMAEANRATAGMRSVEFEAAIETQRESLRQALQEARRRAQQRRIQQQRTGRRQS
ncbi:hypothetical protein OC834_006469 [Tilletia horrida]|nr:hypothetical protein OC834_006469 [Tilletia horrida]KAK0526931.1 hypothetical protein OC835_005136 [Tilletia horrida]